MKFIKQKFNNNYSKMIFETSLLFPVGKKSAFEEIYPSRDAVEDDEKQCSSDIIYINTSLTVDRFH